MMAIVAVDCLTLRRCIQLYTLSRGLCSQVDAVQWIGVGSGCWGGESTEP